MYIQQLYTYTVVKLSLSAVYMYTQKQRQGINIIYIYKTAVYTVVRPKILPEKHNLSN